MLFGLSLSLSKKQKKNGFLKNKYAVHNWDFVHCLLFRLYYFKNFGESSKPARSPIASSKQDSIIAY